jgi:segregation and condensation protein A
VAGVEYQVKLPVFEGPFALLFHLIEKAEVDICDIPLAGITAQYLEHLQAMHDLDLEVASEFLVMAATLLKLKSKKLLPAVFEAAPGDDDQLFPFASQEELVQRLLEYRYFRNVAGELRVCEQAQKRVYLRSLSGGKTLLVNPEDELSAAGVTLPALLQAFQRLLAEQERQPQEVVVDEISIEKKMRQVMRLLGRKKEGVDFMAFFPGRVSVPEIIATFFALLELVRRRKIRVWQPDPLGSLVIMRRKALRGVE